MGAPRGQGASATSTSKGSTEPRERPTEPKPPARPEREAGANPLLQVSFREWLESMDDSKFLLQYHDSIASNFDSLEQVVDVFVRPTGELDNKFFEVVGIKKLGHKRILQKWFKDHLA